MSGDQVELRQQLQAVSFSKWLWMWEGLRVKEGGLGGLTLRDKTEAASPSTASFVFQTPDCLQRSYTSAAMTTVVLKLVCALLCAVFASAEVMPMTDFELEKIGGKWYLIGFATNAKWFVNHKADMKVGTAMMAPTEDGDLDLSYANLKDDGSCWRMTHLAKKTEIPGRFVFFSQRWENDNDMRVVDAKYDEYAIVHTIKTKGGVSEVLNKLYSRTTEITEDLKEKFRQFSLDTGILEENIAILPPNQECSEP